MCCVSVCVWCWHVSCVYVVLACELSGVCEVLVCVLCVCVCEVFVCELGMCVCVCEVLVCVCVCVCWYASQVCV